MTNLTKRQKEIALVILSSLFFIVLAAYAYFMVYAPVKGENEQVKLMLSNEREVMVALRKQEAASGQVDTVSSQPLQRKVPVKPLEDAVLLQIGRAEIKSGSAVQDIQFTKGEFVIQNPPEQVGNVQQLLTEVSLEADSYLEVENFIDEIERMERIFIVDSINFIAPEEIQEQSEADEPMQMTVAFSAFYRPDLVDLQHEAPKTDAPAPEGKNDPTPYNNGTEVGDLE